MNTGICPLCSRRCVVALSARTLTHTLVYSHSVTHTHTHSCIHSHTHDLTLSHTLVYPQPHSCTHTQSLTHTNTHSCTHCHTHALTLTLTHTTPDPRPQEYSTPSLRRLGPTLLGQRALPQAATLDGWAVPAPSGGGGPAAHHPPGASLTAPSSAPQRGLRVPAERLLSPLGSHTHTW